MECSAAFPLDSPEATHASWTWECVRSPLEEFKTAPDLFMSFFLPKLQPNRPTPRAMIQKSKLRTNPLRPRLSTLLISGRNNHQTFLMSLRDRSPPTDARRVTALLGWTLPWSRYHL